jgi:hypothetical protein
MRTIPSGRMFFLALFLFLFLLVGGGTALASYVVSSNSQIGPNTVSGHHPPTGMHANLIAGSVNGQDLASGAVTTPTLAPNSVTGAKVLNGSLAAPDLAAPVRLPQGCSAGQIAKRSATGWACGTTTPSGAAGGALAGSYPNPTLSVSGGDSGATACKNGEALTGLSAQAALTCSPGVYSDANENVAASPNPFPALQAGGVRNVAVGPNALSANTTGPDNAALGRNALSANTTGGSNTAVGSAALPNNTTGSQNSALGQAALLNNTGGLQNTAVGTAALTNETTGDSNLALGNNAGFNITTGSGNIDIASGAPGNESSTIRIGGTQTKAFLAGVSGTTIGATTSPVLVDTNGQLGTMTSSRRFKRDIHPIGAQRKGLMALKPVSFRYRRSVAGGPSSTQFGLIAEQVAKVYPNLVVYGHDGRPSAVAYQELPALELAQLQHQHAELRRQRSRNRAQDKEIATLRHAVGRLARPR